MKVSPPSKVRTNLSRLLDIVERKHGVITITPLRKPGAMIISKGTYDGWQETVEIMKDPELMGEIRDGIRALKQTNKRYTLERLFGSQ